MIQHVEIFEASGSAVEQSARYYGAEDALAVLRRLAYGRERNETLGAEQDHTFHGHILWNDAIHESSERAALRWSQRWVLPGFQSMQHAVLCNG
jgi:hypothetical protein